MKKFIISTQTSLGLVRTYITWRIRITSINLVGRAYSCANVGVMGELLVDSSMVLQLPAGRLRFRLGLQPEKHMWCDATSHSGGGKHSILMAD